MILFGFLSNLFLRIEMQMGFILFYLDQGQLIKLEIIIYLPKLKASKALRLHFVSENKAL